MGAEGAVGGGGAPVGDHALDAAAEELTGEEVGGVQERQRVPEQLLGGGGATIGTEGESPLTPPPPTVREGLGDRGDGERAPGTDTHPRRAGDGDGRRGGIR